ncbi:MAG: ClpXP protease specificity-enhancing factor SspB [Pseudomonadota bacterium]
MKPPSEINYGRVMERAMRSVMAEVLGQVAEHGLPGDHHFYITFETTHAGVDIPGHLKATHPQEMMIVIREWFDDLAVMGDRFRVTLNFSNNAETLVIPFDAVKTFIDPSVKFGLKFDDHEAEEEEATVAPVPEPTPDEAPGAEEEAEAAATASDKPAGSAEVVSLDTFRKT